MVSRPKRAPRPGVWFDPRLLIGLVLVLGAVGGVALVAAGSDRTTAVYAARDALMVGDRVTAADLELSQVRLDGALPLYVTPERMPADGLVLARTVAAGELIPVSAVGASADAGVTTVVVELTDALAEAVVPGAVVDVWSSPQTARGEFGPPTVLVGRAGVVRVLEPSGLSVGTSRRSVELRVPSEVVAAVLTAIANRAAIAVVPANQPLGG
ncbi:MULTISPECIES: hypothetical protein [unclassified Cryobacterium]|uniref:hypothetical protein n=1 Tax=unclassified Cryobacterium TaxID=2649013 RepID=UPI002AB45D1E|nr:MULTISPECIES: hypothetical protein [unclassified Cryobacterium]MDY7542839.1 hypothetical protein [Cryobacterium sp. 5B3]MEA9999403.1 hypothetical protein [Cryobacterium sp. RTS3]MEB0275025.1 hypothetical protein [Cryobacterium sp. 5B3]